MSNRIRFTADNVIHNERVHAAGDVIEIEDDDQYARFVKREKVAVDSDDAPTVFPAPVEYQPVETAAEEPPASPDNGQANSVKAVKSGGNRR
jgi:hypothetical protein